MDEYAENVKQTLEENGVLENGIPFSNVTPAQRDALYKAGVKITEPTGNGKNANSMKAYEEWKRSLEEGGNGSSVFSRFDDENKNANNGERNGVVSGNSSSDGRLSSVGKAHLSHNAFSQQNDDAKILKDTKIAKKIKKSQNIGNVTLSSNDIDDIVRGISGATGLSKSDSSNSHYGEFYEGDYSVEGKVVKVRVSNHPSSGDRFGNINTDDRISIVVRKNGHPFGRDFDTYVEYTFENASKNAQVIANAVRDGIGISKVRDVCIEWVE